MKLIKRLQELLRGIKGYQGVLSGINVSGEIRKYQEYHGIKALKCIKCVNGNVRIRMKHLDCRDINVTFMVLEMDMLVI